jgi:Ca2+-binding RTX toxin-like protein
MKGGADVVSGGRGHDRFITAPIMSTAQASLPILVDLARGLFQWHGEQGNLRSIEVVRSTQVADRILGNGHGNRLLAGAGDDIVGGRGGDDHIDAGHGRDTVTAGRGFDVCISAEVRTSCERVR